MGPSPFPLAPQPYAGSGGFQPYYPYASNQIPGGAVSAMGIGALAPFLFGQNRTALGLDNTANFHNRMNSLRQTEMHNQVINGAAQMERGRLAEQFLTWQVLMQGTPGTAAEMNQWQAAAMAKAQSPLAGMAIQAMANLNPSFLDSSAAGGGGSLTAMADAMFRATRKMSSTDPFAAPRRGGMSAEQTLNYTQGLFNNLYGTEEARAQMGSVSAREAGEMVGELRRRGMIPSTELNTRDLTVETVRRMAVGDVNTWNQMSGELATNAPHLTEKIQKLWDAASPAAQDDQSYLEGLSGKELEGLSEASATFREALSQTAEDIDVEGITKTVRGYSKAVTAISEIFGDPNTPMRELFQGLDALVRGGLPQLSDAELATTVRTTMNLADDLDIDIGTAVALSTQASQAAQAMGINPLFGTQAAQGSMAFLRAYQDAGGQSAPAWGLANAGQLAQMDTQLRLGASQSEMGNQIGAAIRIAEIAGPDGVQKGSAAEAYVKAAQSGKSSFVDPRTGKTRSLADVREGEFEQMMSDGVTGMNQSAVAGFLKAKDLNAEYGYKANAQQSIRAMQRDELIDEMARVGVTTQQSLLEATGAVSGKQANRLASRAMAIGGEALFELSPQELSDHQLRDSIIGGKIIDKLSKEDPAIAKYYAGLDAAGKARFARQMGAGVYNAGEVTIDQIAPNLGGIQNAGRLFNQDIAKDAGANVAAAQYKSMVQEAVSGEGKGNMMERFSRAMAQAGKDGSMGMLDIIAESLNVKDNKELRALVKDPLERLQAKRTEMIEAAATGEAGEADRQRLIKEIDAEINTLTEQLKQFDAQTGGELTEKLKSDVAASAKEGASKVTVENGFEIFGTIKIDDGKTEREGKLVDGGLEPSGPEGAAPTPANTN